MRLEVKTCNNVRIILDLETVKSQRRIINGEQSYCQVTLTTGKIIDIEKPISEIPIDPDINISKKFMHRLNQKMEIDVESSDNGQSV